jgi:hypothetical protein
MEEVIKAKVARYNEKKEELDSYFDSIEAIIRSTGEELEGNSVYIDKTFKKVEGLIPKQINLFNSGSYIVERACEIGFNAGHSTLLLLMGANDKNTINYTIFDLAEHKYTIPSFKYVASKFSNIKFEFYKGDSIKEMEKWVNNNKNLLGTYDLVHVDDGHSLECIQNDMYHADLLLKSKGIMIVDDVQNDIINNLVNCYIQIGKYKEVNNIFKTFVYPHRILQKIK